MSTGSVCGLVEAAAWRSGGQAPASAQDLGVCRRKETGSDVPATLTRTRLGSSLSFSTKASTTSPIPRAHLKKGLATSLLKSSGVQMFSWKWPHCRVGW